MLDKQEHHFFMFQALNSYKCSLVLELLESDNFSQKQGHKLLQLFLLMKLMQSVKKDKHQEMNKKIRHLIKCLLRWTDFLQTKQLSS